jgi:HK97 family phage major capsid protein
MSEIANRLRDQRLNLVNEMRALVDLAAEENRDFTGEESGRLAAIDEQINRLDERIKGVLEQDQRAKDTDDAFNKLEGKPVTGRRGEEGGEKDVSAELRAFLVGGPTQPREFEVRPDSKTVPTSQRDLSRLSNAAGQFTVPTSFYNQLQEHMIEVSGVLQAGPTVLNTTSGEVLQIPKTLTHTPSPAIVLEAGALLESDGTFGQVSLGAFKYGRLLQVSRELLTDTGVDLEGYLARSIGRALGNAFGSDMIIGAGTTAPRGVQLDANAGVTGPVGTTTTFGTQSTVGMGFDLLISLYHSVISPYRMSSSCAFLMNDTTASMVRRIKNTNGDYVWQPSSQVGAPDSILGKPVYIDPFVVSPAASAESIFFGDWSAYFVRYAGGIRFERSDDFAFGNDLVSFRAILRADAALVDLTGAIKSFTHSAI